MDISLEAQLIQEWADQRQLLPHLQGATKPGVQGRDLTSVLAMIQTWSNRTKTPIYILRKDQAKGFDFLSLQAFYNAINFTDYNPPLRLLTGPLNGKSTAGC